MGISDDIIKQIESALQAGVSKDNLRKTAKETTENIKKRTRLGRGVEKDGDRLSRLEPLEDSYKRQRRNLRKKGKLSSQTAPAKSNLTKSGEMLDDLTYKVRQDGFEIGFKSRENEKKAEYVHKNGRKFMFLSKFELKLIIEGIIDRIRRSK